MEKHDGHEKEGRQEILMGRTSTTRPKGNGPGHGGPASGAPASGAGYGPGAGPAKSFAADHQPPGEAKSAGKEVAAEIRARIAAQKDAILDAQLARATDALNPSGHAAAVDLLNRIMPPVSKIELSEATPDQMTDEQLAAIASRGSATAAGKAPD
jgi:hypothetical protein